MSAKTIGLLWIQAARLLLLIKHVKIVPLLGTRDWAILIEGRGFSRLLKREVLYAPNLLRGYGWHLPKPETFTRPAEAREFLAKRGLAKLL